MKHKKSDNAQKRYVPVLSTVIEIIIGIVALFISIIPTFYKELDSLSAISIVGACLMFSVTITSIFSDYKIRKSIDTKLSENSQLFTEKLRVIEDVVSIDEIYKHIYEVQNTYGREFYTKKVKTFMEELSEHVIDLYSGILERNAYYSYLHHLADDAIGSKTAECWALTSFQETEWDRQDPLELKWQTKLKELNSTIKVKRVCVFSAKQQEMIKRSDILEDGGEHQYFLEQLHWYILNNRNIETLVLLSKKTPTSHINVEVEFGEGEGQLSLKKVKERAEAHKPKEKVTYKKIQDYIEKTYSFKVHTAYIAEVKRDLGLPMYDAPNSVEELKHPRAHPTPKMVEAIKETLKHFEII